MNYSLFEKLKVVVESDQQLVAASIAGELARVAALGDEVCAVFATGETQVPVLSSLADIPVDWSKIRIFHLDEFAGIGIDHPASFARFIKEKIADRAGVSSDRLHLINGALDPEEECSRYSAELSTHLPDLCILGIGGNGHLAFNEPGSMEEGEYRDLLREAGAPQRKGSLSAEERRAKWPLVKIVNLNEETRSRQVEEGLFGNINEVPSMAITLSMTAILSAKCVIAVCTGEHKAGVALNMLKDDISPDCPASLLRLHDNATLFLDRAAASRFSIEELSRASHG